MGKIKDIAWQRFGRLTVVEFVGMNKKREALWLCVCDCGNEIVTTGARLRFGATKSCGCYKKDRQRETTLKHGYAIKGNTHYPTYHAWQNMKDREVNPNNKSYKNYRGRGIGICERWLDEEDGFLNFLEDMGLRPSNGHSIDRIDNNGNYEPENCRWATREEQSNNRRSSIFIEFEGKKQTISQWGRELGIGKVTLRSRIYQHGWSIEKALTTPVKRRV